MGTTKSKDRIQAATEVFHSLVSKRLADKYKAVEFLEESMEAVDLPTLTTLLIKAITKDYYVGKEWEQEDREIADTRSWLLGVLARISAGDGQATKLVIKYIFGTETNHWSRFWALKGLIAGKNPQAGQVARDLSEDQDYEVRMLAIAFLASLNDQGSVNKIKAGLDDLDPNMQGDVIRALRIVPLPFAADKLSEIVNEGGFSDLAYDAIVALGNIPSDWNQAPMAARALSAHILKIRSSSWQDSMRVRAIAGLGNLKAESSAPLIMEELADDNPAIVREAARAIEKVLGLRLTVIRVVEAASKSDAAGMDVYARALRWLNREAVAEELETLMTTGAANQQEVARKLMSELGGTVAFEKLRARTNAMKEYTSILEQTEGKVRELFEASVHEAQRGFQLAVTMDVIVFAVGILLIVASAGYALFATGDLSTWAGVGLTGGLGVLGVVYGVLISNPRRQVRESVDHLMLVKIVFLAYLRRLHQADQAYTRGLLDDEPITVKQVKLFADMVGEIMQDTIQQQLKGRSPESGAQEPNGGT